MSLSSLTLVKKDKGCKCGKHYRYYVSETYLMWGLTVPCHLLHSEVLLRVEEVQSLGTCLVQPLAALLTFEKDDKAAKGNVCGIRKYEMERQRWISSQLEVELRVYNKFDQLIIGQNLIHH